MLQDHVPLAVDILADILTESAFDEEELEREKNVILQEIGAANDTPDDIVFDKFSEVAYPRPDDRPRRSSARRSRCMTFEPNQIRRYLSRNYSTERMYVVAAGAIEA